MLHVLVRDGVAMFMRLWGMIVRPAAMGDAERILRCRGSDALEAARHAALAHDEQSRNGHWTRVLMEIVAMVTGRGENARLNCFNESNSGSLTE